MTRATRLLAPACLSLCLAAAPAGAQALATADPATTPGWVFTPSFGATTAYDDNVAVAARNGPQLSDQVTALTASLDAQHRTKHGAFTFGYVGTFSDYRQFSVLDSFEHRTRADSRHNLSSRVVLTLHDGLAYVPSTDLVHLNGIPFIRTGSYLDDARAGLEIAATKRTTVGVGYTFEWVKFDPNSPFSRYLHGGQAHGAFANVTYQLRKRLAVGAAYSFRRALVAGGGGVFNVSEITGTVKFQATQTLSLSGALGASQLSDISRAARQVGPAWSLSATQAVPHASVSVAYLRSYVPSFGLGGTVQNEELDANIRVPFLRNRLYWLGGLSRRSNQPLTPGEQPLQSLWLSSSAGYTVKRWLRVEGYYWRSQQNSQIPGGRVDRSRLGVQVVTSTSTRFK